MDCFVASAPRNDVANSKRGLAIPRRDASGFLRGHPRRSRERGMPGARCTRGLVCKIVRVGAHEHTGSAETLRHPPRNGFTAYGVISPATNSFLSPSLPA